MEIVTADDCKKLSVPARGSHKGQNGRLLFIGGSHLFHAATLWALTVASRIVDLVHFSSVAENNAIVQSAKEEFRNGIVIPQTDVDSYIEEDDCILIGPGMVREPETATVTNALLQKYPEKQWVIDAGALQMMDISLIPKNAILTPHHGEFASLWQRAFGDQSSVISNTETDEERVKKFATQYKCIVLLKGARDIACDGEGNCKIIEGGNPGMTKGGTGDVLSGLVAALACKNDPFLATCAASFINKKAGDELYKKVGPFFNATDLANQIPETMKELIIGI